MGASCSVTSEIHRTMSMVISVIHLALVQFPAAVLAYTRPVVRENGHVHIIKMAPLGYPEGLKMETGHPKLISMTSKLSPEAQK